MSAHKAPLVAALLLATAGALPEVATDSQGLRVEPDSHHVVAARLAGTWEPDRELCERLGAEPRVTRLEVQIDTDVAASVPLERALELEEKQVFLAGTCSLRLADGGLERYPFVLVTESGTPHLVTFRERDGEPLAEAESMPLSLVPARDRLQDLLFLGGPGEIPYRAFRRVPAAR